MRTEDKTELYTRLNYTEYKFFEAQLREWEDIETSHVDTDNNFYHKALRLELGSLIIEVQGPTVKGALKDDTIVTSPPEEEPDIAHCTCTFKGVNDYFYITTDPECPYHTRTTISVTQGDPSTHVSTDFHGESTVSTDAGESGLSA